MPHEYGRLGNGEWQNKWEGFPFPFPKADACLRGHKTSAADSAAKEQHRA
jgi:hypothetical protein